MSTHRFVTDLLTIRLSPEFVIEADSAYPDKRCTRNPRWAKELFAPINRLADESYKAGDDFACINSLSDLRQYL